MNSTMKLVRSVVGRTAAAFALGGAAMLSTGCTDTTPDVPKWLELFKHSFDDDKTMRTEVLKKCVQPYLHATIKKENMETKLAHDTHEGFKFFLGVSGQASDLGDLKAKLKAKSIGDVDTLKEESTVFNVVELLLKDPKMGLFTEPGEALLGGAEDNKENAINFLKHYHIEATGRNKEGDNKKTFDNAVEYVKGFMFGKDPETDAKTQAIAKIKTDVQQKIKEVEKDILTDIKANEITK